MHKQSMMKDQEINQYQKRQADYETRIVLLQEQSKNNRMLEKMHKDGGINLNHMKAL